MEAGSIPLWAEHGGWPHSRKGNGGAQVLKTQRPEGQRSEGRRLSGWRKRLGKVIQSVFLGGQPSVSSSGA